MPPERPITVRPYAFAAASALRKELDAVAPGKYTVGVGLKQSGGEFSDQVALFVYVSEKRPAREVPEAELVPPEFGGYVTDVVEHRPTLASDEAPYDPLRGGIQISRENTPVISGPRGTLGAIVRSRQDGRQLLLTCAHVVESRNLRIYQPQQGLPGATVVGTALDLRDEGSPVIVDCAVIEPNSTRGIQKTVEGIGPVKGVSTALPPLGEVVKKRGARTLLTEGFVARYVPGAGGAVVSALEISGAVPLVSLFAGKGDSGSVLLNTSDQVIGLLYGIPNEDLGTGLSSRGFAMPILRVQDSLQVDVAVAPGVLSITPTSAVETIETLGRVVIEGWGFDESPQVFFDQVPAAVWSATPTRLAVQVPFHFPGTVVDVSVGNAFGDFSEANPQSKFIY